MSIAELIMTGTNRASESTAWVGDSLAKLGQNVRAALAQKQQQKQAQEMLPFLQQSMQESMALAGSGKTGEAYAKLMPFLTDPSTVNNPYVLPAIGAATKFIDEESNNFLKKEQLRIQEGMYNQRSDYNSERIRLLEEKQAGQDTSYQQGYESAAGIGGPRNVGTPLTSSEQQPIIDAAKDVTNSVLLPDEVPQQASGLPAMETKPFTMESDAAIFAQLAEQPYQPSEEVVQKFQKNFNQYQSASPKGKQKIESERTIVYDNVNELKNDLPNLNTQFDAFTQLNAGAVDPTLVGAKYLRDVEKGKNAKGQISGYEPNVGAVKSVQELQTAFNLVNGRRDLSELYTKAGGWKGVELKGTPEEKATGDALNGTPAKYEVINKKTNEAIKVSKEDYDKLQTIEAMIATSNTMKMDLIRLKGEELAAEAPAPTQDGLPATQFAATSAVEVPEEAVELQKIVEQGQAAKAKETANSVEKRIKDIDAQIKRLASPTTIAYDQAGLIAVERPIRKTPEEAQADIQKIAQFKKQKKILQGKFDTAQEVGDAFASGLLTREQAATILKNQFKM
jgi:hypothetical protein